MKRGADGDMGSPLKRSKRAGDEEVRLLIPSKLMTTTSSKLNTSYVFLQVVNTVVRYGQPLQYRKRCDPKPGRGKYPN
ncbi:hypothetical protein HUJ05_012798 [Dendroctonus ponderosae]|nr:hypothetical protein HUJ05_012798 [Dendroctonus ponderosae]